MSRKKQNLERPRTKSDGHGTRKDLPFIFYVDFTDYVKIITRKDNWKQVFKNKEAISVKLRELEPIRNAIAHFRELSHRELEKLKLLSDEIISCFQLA